MNKMSFRQIVVVLTCTIAAFSFFSCDKEDKLTIPEVKISFSTNADYLTFIKNGDVLECTLKLNAEESSEGVHIDKVEYYWDEQTQMTALDSDHKFSMKITNQALGEHTLRAEVHCSGDGYMDYNVKLSHTFIVVEEYPVINFLAEFPDTIANGDVFTCSVVKDEGNTLDVSINKVTYYWDSDKLIETSVSPYLLSYPISGMDRGEHVFKVAVSLTGDLNVTITYPYAVTVE